MNPRLRVLVVEDDEDDILFLQRAFRAHCGAIELEVARDGDEALQRLSNRDGASPPDRVILDLKLPRRSGIEVLAWIRSQPALRELSVTVLTSSGEPSDLARVRELGVDDYLVKPVSYAELLSLVGRLCARWGIAADKS